MLSYQHAYHAGNLADVQKHALLAWTLAYMTRKAKPISYIETHAGRGLYDLSGAEAQKTGEAAQGIQKVQAWFAAGHPYTEALARIRAEHGPMAYPGSPLIAAHVLRDTDRLHFNELHPAEARALRRVVVRETVAQADGFAAAHSLLPPDPRRGALLIDPSFEVKDDYETIPGHIARWHRAWNVGVIMLWYPRLASGAEKPMVKTLRKAHGDALFSEVSFPPARPGHGMIGSGFFVLNPPYGLAEEALRLETCFKSLK